ncbi:hypothetical protein WJX84_011275, partial [Apatococcus fuscideae]
MGGPAAHGQKNKAHKPGRKAGKSARQKHKDIKGGVRPSVLSSSNLAFKKVDRQHAAKTIRDQHRAQLLAAKRDPVKAPRIVAILPLSKAVDVTRVWDLLLNTAAAASVTSSGPGIAAQLDSNGVPGMDSQPSIANESPSSPTAAGSEHKNGAAITQRPQIPTRVALGGRNGLQMLLLPPPQARDDPLATVDLCRAAEVVLMVLPGGDGVPIVDPCGLTALAVMRAMGIPTLIPLVHSQPGVVSMKQRAADRKQAAAALEPQVAGGLKVASIDNAGDAQQLLRQLSEQKGSIPGWRQQRPSLLVEAASFQATPDASAPGTLEIRGHVRTLGLSPNQLVHIPGAGDFQIGAVYGPSEPAPDVGELHSGRKRKGTDEVMADAQPRLLAEPSPEAQEPLVRENMPDPLAGEQTWPTEEELMDAEGAQTVQRRRVPAGTSDYQAAWILDDDGAVDDEEEADRAENQPSTPSQSAFLGQSSSGAKSVAGSEAPFLGDTASVMDGTDDMDADDESDVVDPRELKQQRREQEQGDAEFPDEVDTPDNMPARLRFAKYRGLQSWRTSSWDPKESLPRDYARVFAFQNFKATHKRARTAALKVADEPDGIPAGTYVALHVANVSPEQAAAVVARTAAAMQGQLPPLIVTGLLQHESKLSVLNFSLKRLQGPEGTIQNKDDLLFVTGLRSFMTQPILSTDEPHADKHKLERFLHPGRQMAATIYGPICYPQLPLLVFRLGTGSNGRPEMVAT